MLVIAHRGASLHAPEHTLAAYDLALDQGADVLEIDLRITADAQLVTIHDPTLERTVGDPREVAALRLEEILELDPATRPVPLDTVLGRYGERAPLLIELKDPEPVSEGRLVEAIERHGLADRVVVQSFDHAGLRRIRRLERGISLAALFRRAGDRETVLGAVDEAARWAGAITCYHPALEGGDVLEAAHRRGLAVWTYTINDDGEAERVGALGVQGIVTDAPDRVRDAADRRAALAGR